MTSLQELEERISKLENQVYGPKKSKQDISTENSVIENMLHANTLISSALKGRENVKTLIKRLPELDSYLDKNLEDYDLQTDAKLKLLLSIEAELKQNLEMTKKMKSLMPVLEADKLKDVPQLSEKITNLTLSYMKANEETEKLSIDVNKVYSHYTEVINEILDVIVKLDSIVTAAEVEAITKK